MSKSKLIAAAAATLSLIVLGEMHAASAACLPIRTAAELQAIKNNLSGIYCLKKDIDLSSISNFVPIGDSSTPFTGQLLGNDHVVRNLHMSRSQSRVALFGSVTGTIQDITFANAKIRATADSAVASTVTADLSGGTLRNVHVSGEVSCTMSCRAGGIIGGGGGAGTLLEASSAAVNITVPVTGSDAGGALGGMSNGTVQTTFSTGRVTCGDNSFCAGFVASAGSNNFLRSYATGNVTCGTNGFCGGFIGSAAGNTLRNVYSTSGVFFGAGAFAGGLIGSAAGNKVQTSYATGPLIANGSGAVVGGLLGSAAGNTVTQSYWDVDTTGVSTSSEGGTGLTTAQLRAELPAGFKLSNWGITAKVSYPFLKVLPFRSTLATLVVNSTLFRFLNLSQLEKSNYQGATKHIDQASLATCYTMIARAVGETANVSQLKDVAIDRYFWDDAQQKTTFRGPVKAFATLGSTKTIGANSSLNAVISQMKKKDQLVLLHGTYQNGSTPAESWMLGTLFTSKSDGTPTAVIANDPFTGAQVEIDPTTKKIVSPKNFPLKDFQVDGYQTITINGLAG